MSQGSFRTHLRGVVAGSAIPHGYTLTVWTAGAVASHAQGSIPSAWDAFLFLAGASLAFGLMAVIGFGDLRASLAGAMRPSAQAWSAIHLVTVGASIGLVALIGSATKSAVLWPSAGFVATATFLAGAALHSLVGATD